MTELNVVLAAVGAAVLLLALFTRPIERSLLSPPLAMVALGALLGPLGLGLLDVANWGSPHKIMHEATRLTLAIALMGVALRLPPGFIQRHWRTLLALLGLGMPLMWLASGLLSYWVLELPLLVALLIGACITPTDPVVASTIVTGSVAERNLPERVRHTLSAEAGSNDGLAYLLVLLPILLLAHPPEQALRDWLLHTLLREVIGAVLLGIALGLLAGFGLHKASGQRAMEKSSFLSYTIALSLLVLGLAKLAGTDGVLAVFVAGVAFDQVVETNERAEEENIQEAVNSFFTLPVFGLFGLMLPWQEWVRLGWPGLALALAVMLLRRVPALLAIWRLTPLLERRRDVWFAGWFGPIGVSALFYAALAQERTGEQLIWPTVSLVVLASLLAHGISASPLARRYGAAEKRGTSNG
jgi:NhaP-type Na+/H+ or K+/H+ antiporter